MKAPLAQGVSLVKESQFEVVASRVFGIGYKFPWCLVLVKEGLLIPRLLGTWWVLEKESL